MAGLDYCSCMICGKRLFYDGNFSARDYMSDCRTTDGIACSTCVKRLNSKIDKLKKHDRRRR